MQVTAARSRAARAGLTVRACVPQRRGDRSGSRGAVLDGRERAARSRTGSATKPLQQLHRTRQKPPYRTMPHATDAAIQPEGRY